MTILEMYPWFFWVTLFFCIIVVFVGTYFTTFYEKKYPIKLTLLWYLMFLGIRTNGMSAEAHRIYNRLQKSGGSADK